MRGQLNAHVATDVEGSLVRVRVRGRERERESVCVCVCRGLELSVDFMVTSGACRG